MQRGILELIGQKAKARNIRRPAPARRAELQQCHLDRVARLGAIDVNRACHRIDLAEIKLAEIGQG